MVGVAMALAQCYLKESGQVIRRGRGGPLSIVNCFRLFTAVFFELVCSACTHFSKLSDMLPSMELSIDSLSDAINIGDDSSLKKKSSSVSIAEDKDKYIMRIYCVALGVQIPTRKLIEYQYLNEALILKKQNGGLWGPLYPCAPIPTVFPARYWYFAPLEIPGVFFLI